MTAPGHEEQFSTTMLGAGYGFRKETIAGMRPNGRDAPKPAILATDRTNEFDPRSTLGQLSSVHESGCFKPIRRSVQQCGCP
jgi:hypothetical protein